MDHIYVNVPKPFNRFPPGFRPVEPALRRFGSLAELSLSSNAVSPVDSELARANVGARRAGSVAPYNFSPVASPVGFSPSYSSNPRVFSPAYDNVPAPYTQRSSQIPSPVQSTHQPFVPSLSKLNQRPETNYSDENRFHPNLRPDNFPNDFWRNVESSLPQMQRSSQHNPHVFESDHWAKTFPRKLSKTQSDSSLFGESPFALNDAPQRLFNRHPINEFADTTATNGVIRQIPIQVRLDDDRVLKIPFQPMVNENNSNPQRDIDSYPRDSRAKYVSDPLDRDEHVSNHERAPQSFFPNSRPSESLSPPWPQRHEQTRTNQSRNISHIPTSVKDPRELSSRRTFSMWPNNSAEEREPAHQTPKKYESFHSSQPVRIWSPIRDAIPENRTQHIPVERRDVNAPLPPPPPPPRPPPPSIARNYISAQRPSSPPQHRERDCSVSPTRLKPLNIPPDFHKELLSVIPKARREEPQWKKRESQRREQENKNENSFERSPAELSRPVHSKVKQAVRVNGFASPDAMSASYPSFGHHNENGNDYASFQVERPESPAANLMNDLEERWRRLKEQNLRQNQEASLKERSEEYGRDYLRPREISAKRQQERQVQQERLNQQERQVQHEHPYQQESQNQHERVNLQERQYQPERQSNYKYAISQIPKPIMSNYGYQSEEPRGILRLPRPDSPPSRRTPQRRVAFDDNKRVWNIGSRGASPAPGGGAALSADAPPHVRAYDDAVDVVLSKLSQLAKGVGGDVEKATADAKAIFANLRSFLWTAAGRAEPDQATLSSMLGPISKQIEQLQSWRESRRNTPFFNHLSAIAEGIPAVGWVAVKPAPAPLIKEFVDSAMFYVNRVLKDNKEHAEWANTWKELLLALHTFVRQTHTTGLIWNSMPGTTPASDSHHAAPRAVGGGGPPGPPGPPPPPPPPPPMGDFSCAPQDKEKAGRDALFAELNKGEAVTSGLRKVTADMQTHKNPSLRGQAPVPAGVVGSAASKGGTPVKAVPERPPRTQLENCKQWTVEYHKNNREIVVEVGDKKQTMYVYKCENCVVVVKGKLNSITLDSCKKTDIVFDALVAQIETINCKSVKIQTLGEMPTLSIQQTDGCQVYLSAAARNAEIISSKSSEMNVLIPNESGEFVEFPVPEQFKTSYRNGKLVTEPSDII